jgi:hypothetical protein
MALILIPLVAAAVGALLGSLVCATLQAGVIHDRHQ